MNLDAIKQRWQWLNDATGRNTNDVLWLIAEVERLRLLLKQVEWMRDSNDEVCCPFCDHIPVLHADDCEWVKAMGGGG